MARTTVVQDSPAGNACPVPFTFQDHQIRTVMVDEQPWFVAKDVSKALGIGWTGATLKPIPDEWKGMLSLNTPRGKQRMATIAEPAVYKLAFRSNKPEADAFTNWVASEVLPAIRKTGQYAAKPAAQGQLTPEQCRHLHDVMDAKVCTRPKDSRRAAYAEAWTRFNRHFRIAKYDQLPQAKYVEALSYIIVMDLKAAQKALPAGNLVSLVDKDAVQRLVSQARAHGGDMHNDVTELWNMIWRDVETWKYPERPMALCQLRYTADEAFRVLGANIECIRCLVRTIDVTYREMRKMAAL